MSELDTSVVKSIKDTLSIVDVVSEYITLQRRGRIYIGLCPFHDDHRPSLDVDPERARYRCWACGAVGDIFSWVMAMEKVSFAEALERLAERAGIPLRRAAGNRQRNENEKLRPVIQWAVEQYVSAFWQPRIGQRAREYMERRGFGDDVLRRFRIGYAPAGWSWLTERAQAAGINLELLARAGLVRPRRSGGYYDWFRDRVIFPILDPQGRPIAFGGRVLPDSGGNEAKYINSPETPLFSKRASLYGLHIARHAPLRDEQNNKRRLVIVEGYTDCMALHAAGIGCAVATLGTALTEQHVSLLRRYVDGAVLVFDADAAGARAADRAMELFLRTRFDVRICLLPEGKDPADFVQEAGADAFLELVRAAKEPLEFRLGQARKQFTVSSVTECQQALDYVLQPLVEHRKHSSRPGSLTTDESLIIDRVAQELRLSYNTVLSRLKELERAGGRRTPQTEQQTTGYGHEGDHLERELLALLLVWPDAAEFVSEATVTDCIETPWIRQAVQQIVRGVERGTAPGPEQLAVELGGDTETFRRLYTLAELGEELLARRPREAWLRDLVQRMEKRQIDREAQHLRQALQRTQGDAETQRTLLRRLFELRRSEQQLAGGAVERVHGEEEAR